jgi:transaldolase
LRAIESSIAGGIPINVTLLFSREQYTDAAQAYVRGIERRLQAGLDPKVASVASIFVSRWDTAVAKTYPNAPRNKLGVAVGHQIYDAYCRLLDSSRWRALEEQGALPQRLLWASTGAKDPNLAASYYVEALAAPRTINTMPEKTLRSLGGIPPLDIKPLGPVDDSSAILGSYAQAGLDLTALAQRLQEEGAQAFRNSWRDLLNVIDSKSRELHSS